jgi:1-aminocyclopropane-1-carboxylate deaminase/D-cysteine desulfhydrase-like pyridoxal-dependent ACC family enzyme
MILSEITPVQFYDGLYWKRDDYFKPFGEYHVNGGKVRQAIKIFEHKLDEIKNKYSNGVVTAASVHSPQSANIAKVANHLGIRCISAVGGTKPENLDKLAMMRLTKYYGSEIRIVAGHGMTAVIHSRMNDIAKDLNYMPIEMGELMEDNPKIIFETTAEQVQNIPDELDNLIVPSGVAIQLAGILIGLKRYNKKVKRIVSVCVGPTREKKIEGYFNKVYNMNINEFTPFEMYAHSAAYSKGFDVQVNGEYIDDIYEGKAHDWMKKNIDYKNEKTLFWVVGKRPRIEDVDMIIGNKL